MLGAQKYTKLIKRQGNRPERNYIEFTPGTPVWVQHRQNAAWETATVINQCAPNSYWIMQENGTEQPKVYRCTRTMLKIRSTPTEWMTESRKSESNIPAIPNMVRDCSENSQKNTSSNPVQSPLPRVDLPQAAFDFDFSEDREEIAGSSTLKDSSALETPEMNGQNTLYTPGSCKSTRKKFGKPASSFSDFTCKDTIAPGSVDYQLKMLNFKLYIYIKARLVQNMTNLQYFVYHNRHQLLLTFHVFQDHCTFKYRVLILELIDTIVEL